MTMGNGILQRASDSCRDERTDSFRHSRAYHRHFQGYAEERVPGKNGKGYTIRRVYVADYYRYAEPDLVWRWNKVFYLILVLTWAAGILAADTRPLEINRIPAVGAAQLLSVLLMIFLGYRLILHLTSPRQMTLGDREDAAGIAGAALVCGWITLAVSGGMAVAGLLTPGQISGEEWALVALRILTSLPLFVLYRMEKKRKLNCLANTAAIPAGANEIR